MSKSTAKPVAKSTSRFFAQKLYQRMSDDLHLTGKADRTRRGYLREVRKLAEYGRRSLDQITENQLRRYFLHLKNEQHLAYGSLRVALSGVKFFYSVTCKRDWNIFAILKLQNITALPEVLTIKQVHQIMDATTTQRMHTYFWTVYSMGLRLNEGLHLQVGDIDASRGLVHTPGRFSSSPARRSRRRTATCWCTFRRKVRRICRKFLSRLDLVGETGADNTHTQRSMSDTIAEAEKLGAICIAPHIDREKTGFDVVASHITHLPTRSRGQLFGN